MYGTDSFPLLRRLDLRKNFLDSFDELSPEWSQFLKTGTMDKPEVAASAIAGPHRLIESGDMEPTTFFPAKMTGKVIGIAKEFKAGYAVSRTAIEDDQYDKINSGARWLGEAARLTYEYRGVAILDDAFAGSIFKCIDGLALCHTAHTLFNSGTGATMATAVASPVRLSLAGINAMLEIHNLAKNWNGDPAPTMGNALVFSPKYEGLVMQIREGGKEPFTGENQMNQTAKRLGSSKNIMSHFKSSVESYFLIDQRKNDAQLLIRVPTAQRDWIDEDTGALMVNARTRFLVWVVDFHGWVGANPS